MATEEVEGAAGIAEKEEKEHEVPKAIICQSDIEVAVFEISWLKARDTLACDFICGEDLQTQCRAE